MHNCVRRNFIIQNCQQYPENLSVSHCACLGLHVLQSTIAVYSMPLSAKYVQLIPISQRCLRCV